MASAAYDLQYGRAAQRVVPQVRVVPGGRRGFNKVRAVVRVAGMVAVAAMVLGLVVSLVYSQAVITELTGQIESAQNDLTVQKSNYDYLSAQMDAITSRSNIQQTAEGRLGLVKADTSQYTYIRLEDESQIAKKDSGAARLFGGFRAAALSLLGNLDQ